MSGGHLCRRQKHRPSRQARLGGHRRLLYRETRTAVEKRKSEGCIAVEMELAGVQAVCGFYGIELYSFIVTGDILDSEEYDAEGLRNANHSLDKFFIALKIADMI